MILQRVRMAGSWLGGCFKVFEHYHCSTLIFRRISEGLCHFHCCLVFKVAENLVSLGISCDAARNLSTLEAGSGNQFPRHKSSFATNFRMATSWLFDELPLLQLMYRSQWKSLSYHLQVDKPRVFCVSSVISSSGPCMVSEAVCASGSRLRLWALWWTGVWHRWLQSLEHWRLGWSARDMTLVGSHADAMANGPNGWLFVAAILQFCRFQFHVGWCSLPPHWQCCCLKAVYFLTDASETSDTVETH